MVCALFSNATRADCKRIYRYSTMTLIKIALFLSLLVCAACLQILGVFPYTGRSHFLVYAPLLEELSKRGHSVTVMSSFPRGKELQGYKDVSLPIPPRIAREFVFNDWPKSRFSKYVSSSRLKESANMRCDALLSSDEYRNFLKLNQRFDIIISEYFIFHCHLTPIIQKFHAPFLLIQTTTMVPWSCQWVGNPSNPAYIPSWSMDYSPTLSFHERVENTLVWLFNHLYYNYVMEVQQQELYLKNAGPDVDYPHNIMENTSVILTNTHFTIHGARPSVPNVIEVGGMHIREKKHLPAHIEKWINESAHGVIYFSLGSMIKGHTFPEEKRQMFLRAFSRLPLRVIWKWEADSMPGKPDNIMIEKWLPQFDILCHPNVKAFIAHGGLLGATEAVHCGVPMVIMPQFGDQFTNAKAIEASGGGLILDYSSLNEESIFNTLTKVLDPSFNKKAKELSVRFRDRPLPPLETAIYWVEYVARHRGAPHLRTAAVGMPLYQYLLLDVLAFLATIFFSLVFIVYYLSRMLFRKLCSRKKSSDKVKIN